MATNYERGRAYEYRAKRELEAQGYTVIRSSGSHGPHDLIAFRGNEKVRCIQIKRTKSPAGVKQLLGKFQPLPADTYNQEMWVWFGGRWHVS